MVGSLWIDLRDGAGGVGAVSEDVQKIIWRNGRMPAKKTIARRDRWTMDEPDHDEQRPQTRGECTEYKDYCPFVSCKHHLYLDVNPNGSITLNFPHLAVDELEETCALNVADRTALTLQSVGDLMNLTRERARQIELRGMMKMKPGLVDAGVETRPFKRPRDQGYAALASALTAADSKTKITRTQRHILCEMIELTERGGKTSIRSVGTWPCCAGTVSLSGRAKKNAG